jgi:hypothetical protein
VLCWVAALLIYPSLRRPAAASGASAVSSKDDPHRTADIEARRQNAISLVTGKDRLGIELRKFEIRAPGVSGRQLQPRLQIKGPDRLAERRYRLVLLGHKY